MKTLQVVSERSKMDDVMANRNILVSKFRMLRLSIFPRLSLFSYIFLHRCTDLDLRYFSCKSSKIVKQVRWHPASPNRTHLVVLTTEDTLRLYDVQQMALVTVWHVSQAFSKTSATLSYRSSTTLRTLPSLGETAIDFDFTPPVLAVSSLFLYFFISVCNTVACKIISNDTTVARCSNDCEALNIWLPSECVEWRWVSGLICPFWFFFLKLQKLYYDFWVMLIHHIFLLPNHTIQNCWKLWLTHFYDESFNFSVIEDAWHEITPRLKLIWCVLEENFTQFKKKFTQSWREFYSFSWISLGSKKISRNYQENLAQFLEDFHTIFK